MGESFPITIDPQIAATNYLRRFPGATDKDTEDLGMVFEFFRQSGEQQAKKTRGDPDPPCPECPEEK